MTAALASLILLIAGTVMVRRYGRERRLTLEAWGLPHLPLPRGREAMGLLLPILAMGALVPASPGQGSSPSGPLMIVCDVSRSMGARDGRGPSGPVSRLEEARTRLREALRDEEGREVGIVLFASRAVLALPPTPDREAVARTLDALKPAPAALGGGSRPGQALSLARLALPVAKLGSLWLVTDGEFHGHDARMAARMLAPSLADVRVISVGGETPATVPGPDGAPWPEASRPARSLRDPAAAAALGKALGGSRQPEATDAWATSTSDMVRLLTIVTCLALWGRIPTRLSAGERRALAAVALTGLLQGATWASLPDLWAGQEAWQRGEPEQAARHYQRALRHRDPHPAAMYDLACVDLAMGRTARARERFTLAEKQRGASRRLKAASAYNLGMVEGRSGRWQAAATAFRRSLALLPGDADARHNLAVAEAHLRARDSSPEADTDALRTLQAALTRDRTPRASEPSPDTARSPGDTAPDW
ncbi:MAG: VWA domain-containing protein [Candidatus Sericytochromatia bacterium]|nr:VWA domain-containing protein [Candidatus Tanganyikabacteria bacterium]